MNNLNITVRSLIIPMQGEQLLLPNASLAEIIGYKDSASVLDGPDWLIGMLEWRGMKVPLMSFEAVQGEPKANTTRKTRIAIFNALGGNTKLPFFAIVVQGIPHLITASQSLVTALAEDKQNEEGVLAHVLVEAEPAMIPDLDQLESMILSDKKVSAQL